MADQSKRRSPLAALLPQDIAVHSSRLIRTRWVAAILELLATAFSVHVLGLPLPESWLYLLGGTMLGYNAVLAWQTRCMVSPDTERFLNRIRRIVLLQVALDWLSMAAFLHLTGGITSPAIAFFFLHVLMVTILLPGQSPYVYAVLALGIVALIAALEAGAVLPYYTVIPGLPDVLHTNTFYVLAQIIFFAVTLLSAVFMTASLMARLRERDRQVMALFQTTEDVSTTLEIAEVLERLARSAAQALSMPGASIRLLDASGERLTMVASHGLSREYLDKGPVELPHSLLDQEALSGRAVIVHETAVDSRIQYPREVVAEGIHSMLVVPIIGHRRPLGVLRVYSRVPDHFKIADAEFVMAIARQGATAIENALAHETLRKSDQERAQFVRAVTHELRAPVTGAQSLLRVLLRDLVGGLTDQQRDIVVRLEKRLDTLMVLINDLLAFATSKAVDMHQPLTPQPLQQAVHFVLDRMTDQAEEKGIHLTCNLPAEALVVRATEDGLVRVLDNLIGNAVKYTPSGGSVEINVRQEAASAVIAVQDTGIGIPTDVIDRLGDEFFRAQNARDAGIVGTGLGLAIVRQLIDYFGGLMSVQSKEGEGSTFTVTIPLADAAEPEQVRA